MTEKAKDLYIKMLQKEILKHQQEAKQHREDVRELFRRVTDIERRLPEEVR